MLTKLLNAGMNVMRMNFSHGDHAEHGVRIVNCREAMKQTGKMGAILLDTKGPEIRTGMIKGDKKILLSKGKMITLTTDEVEGTEKILSISYKSLPGEISPGKHIYIADGLVDLEVQ